MGHCGCVASACASAPWGSASSLVNGMLRGDIHSQRTKTVNSKCPGHHQHLLEDQMPCSGLQQRPHSSAGWDWDPLLTTGQAGGKKAVDWDGALPNSWETFRLNLVEELQCTDSGARRPVFPQQLQPALGGQLWLRGPTSHVAQDTSMNTNWLEMEKARAPHSSTLAWKIPRTEEPSRLQSMGLPRVGHDWSNLSAAAEMGKGWDRVGSCRELYLLSNSLWCMGVTRLF